MLRLENSKAAMSPWVLVSTGGGGLEPSYRFIVGLFEKSIVNFDIVVTLSYYHRPS